MPLLMPLLLLPALMVISTSSRTSAPRSSSGATCPSGPATVVLQEPNSSSNSNFGGHPCSQTLRSLLLPVPTAPNLKTPDSLPEAFSAHSQSPSDLSHTSLWISSPVSLLLMVTQPYSQWLTDSQKWLNLFPYPNSPLPERPLSSFCNTSFVCMASPVASLTKVPSLLPGCGSSSAGPWDLGQSALRVPPPVQRTIQGIQPGA